MDPVPRLSPRLNEEGVVARNVQSRLLAPPRSSSAECRGTQTQMFTLDTLQTSVSLTEFQI